MSITRPEDRHPVVRALDQLGRVQTFGGLLSWFKNHLLAGIVSVLFGGGASPVLAPQSWYSSLPAVPKAFFFLGISVFGVVSVLFAAWVGVRIYDWICRPDIDVEVKGNRIFVGSRRRVAVVAFVSKIGGTDYSIPLKWQGEEGPEKWIGKGVTATLAYWECEPSERQYSSDDKERWNLLLPMPDSSVNRRPGAAKGDTQLRVSWPIRLTLATSNGRWLRDAYVKATGFRHRDRGSDRIALQVEKVDPDKWP